MKNIKTPKGSWDSSNQILPQYVDSDNMYCGTQYWDTARMMLGITEKDESDNLHENEGRYTMQNSLIPEPITIRKCLNKAYARYVVTCITYKGKDYQASTDALKDIPIIQQYMAEMNVETVWNHNFEQWVFRKLYNR